MAVRGTDLVVTQTTENQRDIEAMLDSLRAKSKAKVGVALVRVGSAQAAADVRGLSAAGCNISEALEQGENKGKWTLDRCAVEPCGVGDVIAAGDSYVRESQQVASGAGQMQSSLVLQQKIMVGYRVGVLPKRVEKGGVYISAACESAWIPSGASAEKDTPEHNTGNYHRHNVFEFVLKAGQAKVLPVVPVTAKDGGVMLVVWAP
jgi:hypothetical protein